jgi:hypothetical protein
MLKRVFSIAIIGTILIFLSSCGKVGDADIGRTVVVTASVKDNYIEQDIISNNDGSCEYTFDNFVLPESIKNEATIYNEPISENIDRPSPVSITQIEVTYVPLNNAPPIDNFIIGASQIVEPADSATISFPVISRDVLENFALDYLGGVDVNYSYYVVVKIKLKEVYSNKDLEKQVRFNLNLSNIIDSIECSTNNTQNNNT